MVLMEWEALWKLYKDCSPFKALYRWHYWYIWLLGALGIVLSVGGGVVSIVLLVRGVVSIWREFLWGAILCVSLFWLTAWLVSRMIDKSFEREFAMLYTTYGVKHSSGLRWGYLYYVHFVDRLAEHNYTRQDVAKLRHLAEMAERPQRPTIQFADHPLFWLLFIVPCIRIMAARR